METATITTHSEKQTFELGFKFAEEITNGDIVAFYGDLGSGKTLFIKGICSYFNVQEIVTSPTFTIINRYNGILGENKIEIYHIDLYRIKEENELFEIGFEECLNSDEPIKLIEWSEKAQQSLNNAKYRITIKNNEKFDDQRLIFIEKNVG